MARVFTLTELTLRVRQKSDMENSQLPDAEIATYLNESISELYDLLIENAGQEYFLKTYTFSTTANQDTYFLPSDFYVLKGVDANLGGPTPYPIRPYMLDERHVWKNFPRYWDRWESVRYRLLGHIRDDTDPSGVTLNPGLTLGTIATVAGAAPSIITLENDAPALHFYAGQSIDFYQSSISPNTYVETGTVAGVRVPASGAQQLLVTGIVPLVTTGDTIHLATQGDYIPQIRFTPEPTTATSMTVWYIQHAPELSNSTDVWNGFNGWEEYAVVDAGIKCLEREESDTSTLELRKQRLIRRIQSLAGSRDQGFPERTTDVYRNRWW